jgi:putative GTP pyrophosphokinase
MANTNYVEEYARLIPEYTKFEQKLERLLVDLLAETDIKVHAFEVRVKSLDSFREKVNREGKNYADPIAEITDLVGARIILYYVDDIDPVCRLLDDEFAVDHAKSVDKRETLAADQFGYVSVHRILSLSPRRAGLREWSHWEGLQFEIQVRTVLQHSWAAIDHALRYKAESDVPKTSLRRMVRLSGLLELADQEFAQLRKERDQTMASVAEEFEKGNNAISIDVFSVGALIRSTSLTQTIRAAAVRAGLAVGDYDETGGSHLAAVAGALRLVTISDLEAALEAASKLAGEFFSRFRTPRDGHPVGGSVGHFLAVLLAGYGHDSLHLSDLRRSVSWDNDYCSDALSAGVVFSKATGNAVHVRSGS